MFPIDVFKNISTPFYYYDLGLLRRTLDAINICLSRRPAWKMHYALKANANPTLIKDIVKAGFGADCVSGGELEAAIAAGFQPETLMFAGVGKTDAEILLGLNLGIGSFNVESIPELEIIDKLALETKKTANISLRINPNIDAHTHKFITTGTSEDKFGIPLQQMEQAVALAQKMQNVKLKGLHFHIGSQLLDMTPYQMLVDEINRILDQFAAKGIEFETINVGGGLGVDYEDCDKHPVPDFEKYFSVFDGIHLREGQELHFELGRAIVAQCGSLITRVLYVKESIDRTFAIVDAGFTDLIRPALYGAHHKIENLTADKEAPIAEYEVVGPICESTDCFAKNEKIKEVKRGDLLAIRSAGAYGESMASRYNLRKLPASVFDRQ